MLPLIPLISLAGSLVPELVGLFGGRRAGELAGKVAEAVQQVAGTADPAAAARSVQEDAAKAGALRLRLEEIRIQYQALQVEDAASERQALLETLRVEAADRARAGANLSAALLAPGVSASIAAATPAAVSALVLAGFFGFTAWLVRFPPAGGDPTTLTLLNVVVGALVAGFTAVVNFWLGSSQGSRDKDRTVASLQQAQMQAGAGAGAARAPATALEALVAAPFAGLAPARATPRPGQPGRFDLCLEVVLQQEGGFSNDAADPGGATQMGITEHCLAAWRGRPVTPEEVRALSAEEAKEIYRAQYWNLMRCEDLPRGIDLMVFDFGVNAGPGTSVKLLQRAVGVKPDGAVGPYTLRAAKAAEAGPLIEALAQARLDHYRGLATFPRFGRGWARRVEDVRRQALLMAGA
ncbi:glycoside hydrolase family 108 protein [Roseicella frigidaeris]|uniref:Uncharacterized protein n=1 Tax=Roseicella frigidaeris TaxID=2230885 RepID=A0A327M6H4_9PROT|nr:glycosyl hydrolase 108 family protein [Roseicella frigidaeris]RAI58530.1 hypothetical protein DOO78_12590 [Roseicella frigidaeris]